MDSTTHIIRQQYLDITLNGQESEGMALQRHISLVFEQVLAPALESVLERCAPTNGHLYIDRLELDLGNVDWENWADQLNMVLRENLTETIHRMVTESTNNKGNSTRSETQNTRYQSRSESLYEAYFYFLNTGRLPWQFKLNKDQTLEQAVWEALENDRNQPAFLGQLREVLKNKTARQRLSVQGYGSLLGLIFSDLCQGSKSASEYWSQKFTETEYLNVKQKIREARLVFAVLGQNKVSNTDLFTGAVQLLEPDKVPVDQATWRLLQDNLPDEMAAVVPSDTKPPYHPPIMDGDGIYLDHAGLVILHPFLPMLFEGTGMAKAGQIVDPERALYLLHYLATGATQALEYELTLGKLLCGIPLETPVAAGVNLHQADLDEADALLNAVIKHWSVLRDTSPDSLRGTFLLRPGKLVQRTDGEWSLQIEQRSFDILLEQLPWGISMIQLPWMTQILRVYWGSDQ